MIPCVAVGPAHDYISCAIFHLFSLCPTHLERTISLLAELEPHSNKFAEYPSFFLISYTFDIFINILSWISSVGQGLTLKLFICFVMIVIYLL